MVPSEQANSGKVKINGEIKRISEVHHEYRTRYNDKGKYFIGTIWHCSNVKYNAKYISSIQNEELNEDNVEQIKRNLRRNKHEYVSMYL